VPSRRFLDQRGRFVVLVAALILMFAGIAVFRSISARTPPRLPRRVYFLDIAQGNLIADIEQPSPITTSAGSVACRAYVFACDNCDNTDDRFVAYVEKLNDVALRESRREPAEQRDDLVIARGTFIAAVESKTPGRWLLAGSPEANAIRAQPYARCTGIKECQPPRASE